MIMVTDLIPLSKIFMKFRQISFEISREATHVMVWYSAGLLGPFSKQMINTYQLYLVAAAAAQAAKCATFL